MNMSCGNLENSLEIFILLQQSKVPLHGFEIRSLAESISDMTSDGESHINYKWVNINEFCNGKMDIIY